MQLYFVRDFTLTEMSSVDHVSRPKDSSSGQPRESTANDEQNTKNLTRPTSARQLSGATRVAGPGTLLSLEGQQERRVRDFRML